MALVLDYGSVINHHKSPNVVGLVNTQPPLEGVHFQVRMGFVCDVLKILTFKNKINSFQAIKDIAAGQEFFLTYSAAWFEIKNIPYSDVDYASTMWRPDLHPLPCRENLNVTTGADGRHRFSVMDIELPAGTVMDISPCVKVSIMVVDQFPALWDFVITQSPSQMVCMCARGCRSL